MRGPVSFALRNDITETTILIKAITSSAPSTVGFRADSTQRRTKRSIRLALTRQRAACPTGDEESVRGEEAEPTMLKDAVNTMIGLLVGLVTGFFFERRSTREARQQNRRLEEELNALRTSVYSVGAPVHVANEPRASQQSLCDAVLSRARSTQDAQGRLSKTLLTSYFFARGHRSGDVELAIQELCESGVAREDGKWLEVR